MRKACSRALAGSILLDGFNEKSHPVNCVHVFGRRDAPFESFIKKIGESIYTLVPPEVGLGTVFFELNARS